MFGIYAKDSRKIKEYFDEITGKDLYFKANESDVKKAIDIYEESEKYMRFNSFTFKIEFLSDKEMEYIFKNEAHEYPITTTDDYHDWAIYEICKIYKMAGYSYEKFIEKIN